MIQQQRDNRTALLDDASGMIDGIPGCTVRRSQEEMNLCAEAVQCHL